MRVALISDIHANLVALAAVLADIELAGVDEIVCLGDVATLGPQPHGVLEAIRDLGCVCIMGNHDEFLLDADLIKSYSETPVVVDAVDWCREQMSSDELDFVRTFCTHHEISLSADATLLLFHGSPRSHMEDILATTPADDLDAYLGGASATVMAAGHTHIQMLRQHRGTLLVNPGSVGLPFREFNAGQAPTIMAHAEYAIVEGKAGLVHADLRRVRVDRQALHDAASACEFPLREFLLEQYSSPPSPG